MVYSEREKSEASSYDWIEDPEEFQQCTYLGVYGTWLEDKEAWPVLSLGTRCLNGVRYTRITDYIRPRPSPGDRLYPQVGHDPSGNAAAATFIHCMVDMSLVSSTTRVCAGYKNIVRCFPVF